MQSSCRMLKDVDQPGRSRAEAVSGSAGLRGSSDAVDGSARSGRLQFSGRRTVLVSEFGSAGPRVGGDQDGPAGCRFAG
jgi:hypothetical protein